MGFLQEQERLNVALTRAKYVLYVVGNFTSMEGAGKCKVCSDQI